MKERIPASLIRGLAGLNPHEFAETLTRHWHNINRATAEQADTLTRWTTPLLPPTTGGSTHMAHADTGECLCGAVHGGPGVPAHQPNPCSTCRELWTALVTAERRAVEHEWPKHPPVPKYFRMVSSDDS